MDWLCSQTSSTWTFWSRADQRFNILSWTRTDILKQKWFPLLSKLCFCLPDCLKTKKKNTLINGHEKEAWCSRALLDDWSMSLQLVRADQPRSSPQNNFCSAVRSACHVAHMDPGSVTTPHPADRSGESSPGNASCNSCIRSTGWAQRGGGAKLRRPLDTTRASPEPDGFPCKKLFESRPAHDSALPLSPGLNVFLLNMGLFLQAAVASVSPTESAAEEVSWAPHIELSADPRLSY